MPGTGSASTGSNKPVPAKKSRPKKKRKEVSVGDIIQFHAYNSSMTGTIGEVTHVLNKDKIVVREMSASDRDFGDQEWVILTYKPHGRAPGGSEKYYYNMWIEKIIVRKVNIAPKPPKAPKFVTPPRVLRDAEELLEHLASDSSEKVVFIPESGPGSA